LLQNKKSFGLCAASQQFMHVYSHHPCENSRRKGF